MDFHVCLSAISALVLKLTNDVGGDMEPRVICGKIHDLFHGFELMNHSI